MMRITNLADYALILMCQLARDEDCLHSAVSLSEKTGVPVPTVSKILGNLARNNLLTSQRGLKGGFKLNAKPADVTVGNIIEAIDGPIAITSCAEEDFDCDLFKLCTMRPHWQAINNAVRTALNGISLQEISNEPNPAGMIKNITMPGATRQN